MTTELWQELEDKQAERLVGGTQTTTGVITGLGATRWANSVTIDNKNHPVTTETATGSERGKFSWSSDEIPNAFDVAYLAYWGGQEVTITYSEYVLSPHADPDGDNLQPLYLVGIEFG
ncbi:MAG: hypothetical protein QNJ72_21605 [Pleurocapsa sp. MO_226.B13]|nr:hypothetical protein [Pleurocapsa sp. MO_226.B13]